MLLVLHISLILLIIHVIFFVISTLRCILYFLFSPSLRTVYLYVQNFSLYGLRLAHFSVCNISAKTRSYSWLYAHLHLSGQQCY